MTKFLFSKKTIPYWLLAPTVLYIIIFWLRPVIGAVVMSFQNSTGNFTLLNYSMIFHSVDFFPSLWNTAIFAIVSVTLEFFLALLLALFLNKKFKCSALLLFVAMIPMALPSAMIGIMWRTGFDYYGWINSILCHLGIISSAQPVNWLGCPDVQLLILIIILDAWSVIPSVMIILLAGLQGMPKEMLEAGYAFGASKKTVLWRITIPLLKPTIITAIILRIISAIQIWMVIVMLVNFNRIPVLLSKVIFYANYVQNLPNSKALAAAYSVVVTLIVAISAVFYLKVSGAIGKDNEGR
ncbi:MAG TPA: sugar ABC transporter permease [Victivallales bacterium]|nr:sugar ABC transporter permease [Victivallales bacterium]